MEALVPAVLLRMARVDPFMLDAQLDPPGRQCRQPGDAGRRERRAVVGADHLGQAIVPKSTLEQRFGFIMACAASGRQADQIAAEPIRHRQRLGARAVAKPHPALVIHPPHVIGVLRYRKLAQARRTATPKPPAANQPSPLQDLARRRGRRPFHVRLASCKLRNDLARPPARTLSPQTHDRLDQMFGRRTTMHKRCTRAFHQSRSPEQSVALKPLVACLAADLVALAKLRHRPQPRQVIVDEANPLIHRAALSPRHRLVPPADRELSPIFPVRSVTYLSGLHTSLTLPRKGGGNTPNSLRGHGPIPHVLSPPAKVGKSSGRKP